MQNPVRLHTQLSWSSQDLSSGCNCPIRESTHWKLLCQITDSEVRRSVGTAEKRGREWTYLRKNVEKQQILQSEGQKASIYSSQNLISTNPNWTELTISFALVQMVNPDSSGHWRGRIKALWPFNRRFSPSAFVQLRFHRFPNDGEESASVFARKITTDFSLPPAKTLPGLWV